MVGVFPGVSEVLDAVEGEFGDPSEELAETRLFRMDEFATSFLAIVFVKAAEDWLDSKEGRDSLSSLNLES
jgi:hypothetical protein